MALDVIAQKKSDLIRKSLDATVFIAADTVTLPESLTDASGALKPLPDGFDCVGWLTQDSGTSFSKESEISDVPALGSLTPVRRDAMSNNSTMVVNALETNRLTLELYTGVDLSAVEADAASGEVSFAESNRPSLRYFRALSVAQDGKPGDEIYIGRLFTRASVTEVGEVTYGGEDPVSYSITFGASPDDVAGFAVKHFFGGPGWLRLLAQTGFTQATGGGEG